MIPPIISIRDLLAHHGWGHLTAPIKPAPVFDVTANTRVQVKTTSAVAVEADLYSHVFVRRTWT